MVTITKDAVHVIKKDMAIVLSGLGFNLTDENFNGTPSRFVEYLMHFMQDYDPKHDLGTSFEFDGVEEEEEELVPDEYEHPMVVQHGIPYRGMCAHHLLPVLGTAHVAYIPKKRIVGLSKLTRLVYGISHQHPSLQETVCQQIADTLFEELDCLGSVCVISATHGCMEARGVEESNIITTTCALRGVFTTRISTRAEFYSMIDLGAS